VKISLRFSLDGSSIRKACSFSALLRISQMQKRSTTSNSYERTNLSTV